MMRISDFPVLPQIKEGYAAARRAGKSRGEASLGLIEAYNVESALSREVDSLVFWIALADAQYAGEELSQMAADIAMEALDLLEGLDGNICTADIQSRRQRYAAAPMPEKTEFETT